MRCKTHPQDWITRWIRYQIRYRLRYHPVGVAFYIKYAARRKGVEITSSDAFRIAKQFKESLKQ